MAKDQKAGRCVCPGCSRHCSMDAPRCKYGKKYFAKCCPCPAIAEKAGKARKWKDALEKDGLIRRLLKTGKRIRKGLKRGEITESALLSRLTPSEKESLEAVLEKLNIL